MALRPKASCYGIPPAETSGKSSGKMAVACMWFAEAGVCYP